MLIWLNWRIRVWGLSWVFRAVRDCLWNWHTILGDNLLIIAVTGPFQTWLRVWKDGYHLLMWGWQGHLGKEQVTWEILL